MDSTLDSKTVEIIHIFEQISAVPRSSGHEEKIRSWLKEWATRHGFECQTDHAGNLLIRVPATPGYEDVPGMVLQGHMDMVCEKTPESLHDFSRDPIRLVVDGDWLKADRTTLGADNGMALALAIAIVEDPQVARPALELLFTVEEEVGIGGASALEPGFLQFRQLLNLDSEDEGVFYIGCAGGQGTTLTLPLAFEPVPSGWLSYELSVSGLQGGHSGIDIHKQRASANKLIGRVLDCARKTADLRLAELKGGTAHNAIAREAWAVIAIRPDSAAELDKSIQNFEKLLREEYRVTEKGLKLSFSPADQHAEQVTVRTHTDRVIDLLLALPFGVAEMSSTIPGFVESSSNLATVEFALGPLHVHTSQRSTVMSRLEEVTGRVESVGRLAGAKVESSEGYPAWQPDTASALLERCRQAYRQVMGMEAQVKIIHAGLECGIIGAKYSGMDMVSLGVTIQNPHSPNERVEINSIGKVWNLLVEVLKEK